MARFQEGTRPTKLEGIANPTLDTDAANKDYVDNVVGDPFYVEKIVASNENNTTAINVGGSTNIPAASVVYVNGVLQDEDDYSFSGTTVNFANGRPVFTGDEITVSRAATTQGGGGSGTTNLSTTVSGTGLLINSSTGTNAAVPAATSTTWGAMTDEDKAKLDAVTTYTGQTATGDYTVPVRDSGNTTTKFLREDGDWVVPSVGSAGELSDVASARIIGRVSTGSGASEELTATQVRSLINVEDGADVTPSWVPDTNPNYLTTVTTANIADDAVTKAKLGSDLTTANRGLTQDTDGGLRLSDAFIDAASVLALRTAYELSSNPLAVSSNQPGAMLFSGAPQTEPNVSVASYTDWEDIRSIVIGTNDGSTPARSIAGLVSFFGQGSILELRALNSSGVRTGAYALYSINAITNTFGANDLTVITLSGDDTLVSSGNTDDYGRTIYVGMIHSEMTPASGTDAPYEVILHGRHRGRDGRSILPGTLYDGALADDTVANSKLANMSANTVKVNATAGSTNPTDLFINNDRVLGRGTSGNLTDTQVQTGMIADDAVTNAKVADDAIGIAQLSASGTASATTYLRGDNSWATLNTAITIEDEGTALTTAATTLNFTGSGVTASGTGTEKTITISGGNSTLINSGLAGSWDALTDSITDLSGFLNGAGTYRMLLVGGGGNGHVTTSSTSDAAGGGAGGMAFFTLAWNGTDALAVTIGGSGGNSTFSVAGTVRITCNGGSNGATLTGGAGGTASLTSSHSSISNTTFRSGGSGGTISAASGGSHYRRTGGGGVPVFTTSGADGGHITTPNDSTLATAGGGAFGPGRSLVTADVGGNNVITSSMINNQTGATQLNFGSSPTVRTAGSQHIVGSFFGNLPPGSSDATITVREHAGLAGGAASQAGYLFGGGGGSLEVSNFDGKSNAGGYGAGGGGNSRSSVDNSGGSGILLWTKL